jgi:ribonuclease D
MAAHSIVLADTPERLHAALEDLGDLQTVGVDVERADWDRYWRSAALIQVGGNGRVALVDPLRVADLGPLARFLAARTCVLHAMDNDLGPLASAGIELPRLEDTSIAAAVLGLPLGLEVLLRDLLGVALGGDKAEMQRANWEERPLTAQMQTYAAGDVADLPELWATLAHRLQEAGREDWYRQELEAVRRQPPAEQRRAWTRTKGIGRLDPAAKARLRSLWDTREELAQTTDTAPSRIAGDKLLVDLAVRPPTSTGELVRRGLRRAAVRTFGTALLDAVGAAQVVATEPRRRNGMGDRPGRPPTDTDRMLADTLRALRSERAAEIGIDAGVLCPSRTLLGAVLADPATPDELRAALDLRPWQWDQLGYAFCGALGLDGPGRPAPPAPLPAPPDPGATTVPPSPRHGSEQVSG